MVDAGIVGSNPETLDVSILYRFESCPDYKKIKVMNNIIKNTIFKVSNSFPSLFSKEDVIKLLTDLNAEMQDETPKQTVNKEALIDLFRDVFADKDFDDAVDKGEIELSMGYDNKVEVESVTIDDDFLVSSAVDALEACWEILKDGE